MELKTAEEMLNESMKHLPTFKRMWLKMDSDTSKAVYAGIKSYAAQAVRMALDTCVKNCEYVSVEMYEDTVISEDKIPSLESSILAKLK